LAKQIENHEITWKWVRGHAGNRYNERADKIARDAGRGK
jgi:ribonuclease HI